MEEKSYDLLFKIILIGDSGVGKTKILFKLANHRFDKEFKSTIGVDFNIRTLQMDDKSIKLQIWDTAGKERYQAINNAYYRGTKGIMLIYDIAQEKTFENMHRWMKNIREHADKNVVLMLLAHEFYTEEECDKPRTVTKEQGEELAKEFGCRYQEVNHRDGDSIEEALITMVREIKLKEEGPAEFKIMERPEAEITENETKKDTSCRII